MDHARPKALRVLALTLLAAGALPAAARQDSEPTPKASDTYTVECSYSNPAYSGRCFVSEVVSRRLSPPAACQRILSCLNNSQCIKTYCNSTNIRGGWKVESAKKLPPK
jgi:hypothetical protein